MIETRPYYNVYNQKGKLLFIHMLNMHMLYDLEMWSNDWLYIIFK